MLIHLHQQELHHQAPLKIKIKLLVTIKFMAMIKGEVKMVKLKMMFFKLMMMMDPFKDNHKCLIQEFTKAFNGIIPLTTFLGVFEEG